MAAPDMPAAIIFCRIVIYESLNMYTDVSKTVVACKAKKLTITNIALTFSNIDVFTPESET